jgi:hypothetical protein
VVDVEIFSYVHYISFLGIFHHFHCRCHGNRIGVVYLICVAQMSIRLCYSVCSLYVLCILLNSCRFGLFTFCDQIKYGKYLVRELQVQHFVVTPRRTTATIQVYLRRLFESL